ncbi:MAG: Glycosyl transferase, family 2 [Microgenomates group bacterium GW2011_GWC2_45_8]|nr:MAG: Glycosyl transferase, family 2 [Microgenomates group bacterium GW2011_GWC2_45_8]
MAPLVTVLIPNYNEIENVKRGVLQDIFDYLKKKKFTWEVVISDDGSTDASVLVIKEFIAKHGQFRILFNQHAGKPYALRSGINEAKGKYVLLTDMDQSTPISELDKLLPWTNHGFDIVIGSRGAKRADSTPLRQLASIVFLLVRRLILLPQIKDTQCGFKLIDRALAIKIFSRMRLFGRVNNAVGWKVTAYDVELLHIAKKLGAKIKEVRVIWKNEDTASGKSRNFIKESIEMLFEIMRVRINDMLGKYN